jgi:signal transduction histidine kinase
MMSRARFRPGIRLRLTLIYSGLFLLAGAGLLSINYFLVRHHELTGGTATRIVCQPGPGNVGIFEGTVSAGSSALPLPAGCPVVSGGQGIDLTVPDGAVISRSAPRPIPPDAAKGLAALKSLAKRAQDHTLHTLEVESALALGLMALASLGLGWLIAGRALRPVHRITNTARRLSEETLHERINLEGPDDELKELADTFDAMLVRLDRSFGSQRRFVANASHELRTPLATDRVLIDEALANRRASPEGLRSILEDLRANNEQTERLIDALLFLARSEQGVQRRATADLATVGGKVVEQARAEAVTNGVEIRTDLAPAPATGDPVLLDRLVGNLVENAVRHNLPVGGWLEVETGIREGRPRLRVANSGQVLAPDQLPGLFEPFRRGGADRTATKRGFGLGLSIVRSVVEVHGGRIDAIALADGGLEVVVVLPEPRPAPVASPAASGGEDQSDSWVPDPARRLSLHRHHHE